MRQSEVPNIPQLLQKQGNMRGDETPGTGLKRDELMIVDLEVPRSSRGGGTIKIEDLGVCETAHASDPHPARPRRVLYLRSPHRQPTL